MKIQEDLVTVTLLSRQAHLLISSTSPVVYQISAVCGELGFCAIAHQMLQFTLQLRHVLHHRAINALCCKKETIDK